MKPIFNKKAKHDYEILKTFEAGLVLKGYEVKSVKAGHISLKGSYIGLSKGTTPELFLKNATITKYRFAGNLPDYDPTRPRKLLVNRREIGNLIGKIQAEGLTLIPLKVYTKRNLVKVEVGLAKGKKLYEKKQEKKKQDVEKQIRRTLKFQ